MLRFLVVLLSACLAGHAAMPKTFENANFQFDDRLDNLLKWYTVRDLGVPPTGVSRDWNDLGTWSSHASSVSVRKMAAGLKALQLNKPYKPAATYPQHVETWIRDHAVRFADPGTEGPEFGSVAVSMAATIYWGLAVTSHVQGTLTTGSFDNIQVAP